MAAKKIKTSRSAGAARFNAETRLVILAGVEPMQKRLHLEKLRETLEKAHQNIEVISLNGSRTTLAEVLDELRTFSLMQQYKLVVIDQAEQFVNEQTRPAMERYAAQPVDHATLVLQSAAWRPGRLDKLVEKSGVKIKCDPLSLVAASRWLIARSRSAYSRILSTRGADVLVQRLGVELMRLDGELAKLSLLVEANEPIDAPLIEHLVGRSSDEQAWAVQEAVLSILQRRDARGASGSSAASAGGAIEKLHELIELSGQPEVLVMYFVADLMRKLAMGALMKKQGVSDHAIASEFRLWGERRTMFLSTLRRLDWRRAGDLFAQALRADSRAKSGFGEPVRNIECFCVQLADALQ